MTVNASLQLYRGPKIVAWLDGQHACTLSKKSDGEVTILTRNFLSKC